MSKPAIISIHDLNPDTLDRVEAILRSDDLKKVPPHHVYLLVVPAWHGCSKEWTSAQILKLKELQNEGYELVGHGWTHHAPHLGGWYHLLHSLLISKRAAEHLAEGVHVETLVERNYQWFQSHKFPVLPTLYVPPAWAMGKLSRQSPFPYRAYEGLLGFYLFNNQTTTTHRRLPLAGFEADTWLRALVLRVWNRINLFWASPKAPIRIAIHPYDYDYYLRDQLQWMLGVVESTSWKQLF